MRRAAHFATRQQHRHAIVGLAGPDNFAGDPVTRAAQPGHPHVAAPGQALAPRDAHPTLVHDLDGQLLRRGMGK
jgi:hypothetical protein